MNELRDLPRFSIITSIEELYAWEFNGPARRDMRGAKPLGKGRDAGALESY